jgi:hypothetical protein
MSTKRPSVVISSNIIQKFLGSDYDKVVALHARLDELVEIIEKAAALDAAIATAQEMNPEEWTNEQGFVVGPLLEHAVDFDEEEFEATTLGEMISALALKSNVQEGLIENLTTAIADLADSANIAFSTLNGRFNPADVTVQAALEKISKKDGVLVYADLATQTTPLEIDADTVTVLVNDGDGTETSSAYAPNGISDILDFETGVFDFSDLILGTFITIQTHLDIETSEADQEVKLSLVIGEGSPSEKVMDFFVNTYPIAEMHEDICAEVTFLIRNADIRDSGARLKCYSPEAMEVTINNFNIFVKAYR